jgi:hypothetical protein
LQVGCTADCGDPSGALFCDGNYVDHGGNLQSCIDAIKAALPSVTVDISATSSGDSSCSGSSCQASGQAEASASCAFTPSRPRNSVTYGAFALVAALGAVCIRRRRAS